MNRTKCICGEDMIVIKYSGYYDEFSFFGFNCSCRKGLRVRKFNADKVHVGGYAIEKRDVEQVLETHSRPICACNKEMHVVRFDGYYDTFNYWGFHKDCVCKNESQLENEVDRKISSLSY